MSEAERAIREALPFATPGRWEHFSNGGREHYVYAPDAHYRRDLPGPVKVAWLPPSPGSNRDANDAVYIAACNPENIAALLDELDHWRSEGLEQARLLGISGTTEFRLLTEIDRLTRERDEARAERDAMAKDTWRLDWLDAQWRDPIHLEVSARSVKGDCYVRECVLFMPKGEVRAADVRSTIDAALAQIEQERSEQAKDAEARGL